MIKTETYPKLDRDAMKTALCNIIQNNDSIVQFLTEDHTQLFLANIFHYLEEYCNHNQYDALSTSATISSPKK